MARFKATSVLLFLLVLGAVLVYSQSKKPLKNGDIIQMVKAGFTDRTIIGAIKANDTDFDTSVRGLLTLKNSGVSQSVIDEMLATEAVKRAKAQPAGRPSVTPAATQAPSAASTPSQQSEETRKQLVQQANDLEKRAQEADAKAQELEQKARRSRTGFAAIFGAKDTMEADVLREHAREYRQKAKRLRAQAGESPGSQPEGQAAATSSFTAPSGFQVFDNSLCTLAYPKDWKAYPAQYAIVLSAEPRPPDYGGSGMHPQPPHFGAYITAPHLPYHLPLNAQNLSQPDFNLIIQSSEHFPTREGEAFDWSWGQQLTPTTPMIFNGRPAQTAEFSIFTGDDNRNFARSLGGHDKSQPSAAPNASERDWFIAILPAGVTPLGQTIFCIQFFAPADKFEASKPLFEKIANSIVVKIGLSN